MNPIIFKPWENLILGKMLLYISIGLYFVYSIIIMNLNKSKKIRAASFEKKCIYSNLLIFNCAILFNMLWYVSIPIVFMFTLFSYIYSKGDLIKLREMGLNGGWCLNEEYRKQQMEEFKLKTPEEQNKEIEYYKNFSTKLNPLLVISTFIIPIIIILILWASGVGYRVQWISNFVTL